MMEEDFEEYGGDFSGGYGVQNRLGHLQAQLDALNTSLAYAPGRGRARGRGQAFGAMGGTRRPFGRGRRPFANRVRRY